jgi:hypothetical protein
MIYSRSGSYLTPLTGLGIGKVISNPDPDETSPKVPDTNGSGSTTELLANKRS